MWTKKLSKHWLTEPALHGLAGLDFDCRHIKYGEHAFVDVKHADSTRQSWVNSGNFHAASATPWTNKMLAACLICCVAPYVASDDNMLVAATEQSDSSPLPDNTSVAQFKSLSCSLANALILFSG
jgi:hypothetical protein